MKTIKEGIREYAPGIEKALRRATRQAVLTAAITGTRLVIYEKGRIKRVRPPGQAEFRTENARQANSVLKGKGSNRYDCEP